MSGVLNGRLRKVLANIRKSAYGFVTYQGDTATMTPLIFRPVARLDIGFSGRPCFSTYIKGPAGGALSDAEIAAAVQFVADNNIGCQVSVECYDEPCAAGAWSTAPFVRR
jgi:hypothetical protein